MNTTDFPQNTHYRISEASVATIDEKVERLYKERVLPYASNINDNLKKNLMNLQRMVFIIDHYGENNEDIDPTILASLFDQTAQFIEKLTGDEALSRKLLEDMKDYAAIEISTRDGKRLSAYDIEFFYRKKSCDVRLQRHLLRIINSEQGTSTDDEIIKDILEEIIDDIDDIEEDKLTPLNCNRLLEIIHDRDAQKLMEYHSLAESYLKKYPQLASKITAAINAINRNLFL